MKNIIAVSFAFFLLQNANAKTEACGRDAQTGDVCSISVLEVHPTQFSVGMMEVKEKASKIEGLDKKELKKFLKKHTIPTVIGPRHEFLMTDHHHLARALFEAGVEEINLEIQSDWSSLSENDFWKKMEAAQLVYLFDENGQGPLSPSQLPRSADRLRDDIYRSLAWAVQKQTGAYADTNSPYASFLWANFFRQEVARNLVENNFDDAVKLGAELARSFKAKNLPGYIGPSH